MGGSTGRPPPQAEFAFERVGQFQIIGQAAQTKSKKLRRKLF